MNLQLLNDKKKQVETVIRNFSYNSPPAKTTTTTTTKQVIVNSKHLIKIQ